MDWALGLIIAIFGGGITSKIFLKVSRSHYKYHNPIKKPFPASITGAVEAIFFATVVGFNLGGAAISMFAWIGLKMAIGWNDEKTNEALENNPVRIAIKFTALIGTLINLYFAVLGGLVIRGDLFNSTVVYLSSIT